jgi:RimJ/RimL family protein N-acetyltransferase
MGTVHPTTLALRDGRTVTIRVAIPTDADGYNALSLANASDPNTVPEPDEVLKGFKNRSSTLAAAFDDPQQLILVAECDGTLVGELSFTAPTLRRIAHCGRFGIYVAENARGRGIGEALIKTLLTWAVAHPVLQKVWLGVLSTNPGAVRLYQRLGFVEEARRSREFCLPQGRYADDILMAIYVKPL